MPGSILCPGRLRATAAALSCFAVGSARSVPPRGIASRTARGGLSIPNRGLG